jgi:hypothetical protein
MSDTAGLKAVHESQTWPSSTATELLGRRADAVVAEQASTITVNSEAASRAQQRRSISFLCRTATRDEIRSLRLSKELNERTTTWSVHGAKKIVCAKI